MPIVKTTIKRRLLGLADGATSFAARGFYRRDEAVTRHLEQVGANFVTGYHAALDETGETALAARLDGLAPLWRGFGYEGAAMALALLDCLAPWNGGRFARFLAGGGRAHTYMAHVGAGWAWARLPWARRRLEPQMARLHPLYRWLAVDGYGFHEGFFHWQKYYQRPAAILNLPDYQARAFAQGLGRSLWFVEGADGARWARACQRFPLELQPDLWSGAGLACAYAGGADSAELAKLSALAGGFFPPLAQGVTFAARARQRAGNPVPHTETACRVICGLSFAEAAAIPEAAQVGLPADGALPAYEIWRQRIQARFASEEKK